VSTATASTTGAKRKRYRATADLGSTKIEKDLPERYPLAPSLGKW
jgi:hypothetical protein